MPSKTLQVIGAAASLALSACAASQAVENNGDMPTKTGINEAKPVAALAPGVAAIRFVQYLAQLESQEDLSVEGLEKAMGVTFVRLEKGARYTNKSLGNGWYYVVYMNYESKVVRKGVAMHLDKGKLKSDIGNACMMDLKDYVDELHGLGFKVVPAYGELGQIDYFHVDKKGLSLNMSVLVASSDQSQNAKRICIQSLGTLNSK